MSARITLNGKTYTAPAGASLTVINGKVMIDGKVVEEGLTGEVRLKVEGDLFTLVTDANVECGNVQGDVRADGNVTAGHVGGALKADGNVTCGTVRGDVKADGNVTCGNVEGSVRAGGNVMRRG